MIDSMNPRSGRLNVLFAILSHPLYFALTALSSYAFFYLFHYLVTLSNYGIFLYFLPIYLIYALMITSGILFSISTFAIVHAIASRRAEAAGEIISILMPSLSGLVATCACTFPLLASVLIFLGINTFEAAGIISLINSNQTLLITAMLAINLIAIYYYLGKFQPRAKTISRR